MKWILLFGLLWLSACSNLPIAKKMTPQKTQYAESEIAQAAIEQYQSSGKTELLQQLAEQKPDSVEGRYAAALWRLNAELEQQQAQLANQEADFDRFAAEQRALQQENQQLNETIEQLKKLLIELEQRPR